jgi:hypothetical protein
MEAGIDSRILDAIQGHAARSVAEAYGDVTTTTMAAAMRRFPAFDLAKLALCRESSACEGSPNLLSAAEQG